jgi:hypothetical protein
MSAPGRVDRPLASTLMGVSLAMTEGDEPPDEAVVRAALRAALMAMLAEAGRSREQVLAQAEAEFNALLLGKDLSDPKSAQLGRVIREVLAEVREQEGKRG